MPDKKIFVALSGGVDSAVAAALLLEQGWQVQGVHLQLTDGQQDSAALASLGQILGIDWRRVDLRREFREQVIDSFARLYRQGQTPNPCVRCNELIKFGALLQQVRAWGGDKLATGHYASLGLAADGAPALFRGREPRKEQSYFLHRVPRAALESIVLPLGLWTKGQVRAKAEALGLTPYLPARESQELCFVAGKYADYLHRLGGPNQGRPGPIVSRQGKVLGRHRGLEHYTVGQRQGLGVPGPAPYYVVAIHPETNQIVVGGKEDLLQAALEVADINWLIPVPEGPFQAEVRLRYRHPGVAGAVVPKGQSSAQVFCHQPQSAVTPGQAAVFYQGDRVLGGGWIVRGFDP